MKILTGEAATDRLEELVHAGTQIHDACVDLTVATVARIGRRGSLDFGGSEHERAEAEIVEPQLADPEDDYGWWDLEQGTYRVRYNEVPKLGRGETAWVLSHPRLMAAGAYHPAFVLTADDDVAEVLLLVGAAGCRLKENCRMSRFLVLSIGD